MDSFWAYRRVKVTNSGIGVLYNGAFYLMIILTVPYLIAQHSHLALEKPCVVRFIRPELPKNFNEIRCTEDVSSSSAKCVKWDWLEIADTDQHQAFITTAVKDTLEVRMCNYTDGECSDGIWKAVNDTFFYTVSPESLQLKFLHRIKPTASQITVDKMEGALFTEQVCRESSSPSARYDASNALATSAGGRDTFTLGSLLEAAGVTLEMDATRSGQKGHDDKNRLRAENLRDSFRSRGVHIDLTVTYSNLWGGGGSEREDFFGLPARFYDSFFPSAPKYRYCAEHIPNEYGAKTISTMHDSSYISLQDRTTGIEIDEKVLMKNADDETPLITRVVRRRYGVQLTIHEDGHLASVSWAALLQAYCSFGLLINLPYTLLELYFSMAPASMLPPWFRTLQVNL